MLQIKENSEYVRFCLKTSRLSEINFEYIRVSGVYKVSIGNYNDVYHNTK